MFDQQLYEASLEALKTNGLSDDLAYKASIIVASDNPELPDWGRTPEDQELIKEVVNQLNQNSGSQ